MQTLYDRWKKDMMKKLDKLERFKPKKVEVRCPKCQADTLEFNPDTGKVHCKKCGYEDYVAKVMKE
ncbi:hypothetical protein KY330_03865 [Candidatus Woesearchaeota archaeon]|nr:hypothetical protein [Candidatus Woesearchaeota archaeon]